MKVLLRALALASGLTLFSAAQAQGLFSDDEARRAILDLRAKITALETENQSLVNRLDGMAKGQLDLFGVFRLSRQVLSPHAARNHQQHRK